MTEWLYFLLTILFGGFAGGMIAHGVYNAVAARLTKAPEQPAPVATPPGPDQVTVENWLRWNSWYQEDQALALEAQSIHVRRQRTHPGEPLAENLMQVSLEMRRRHGETIEATLN